MTIKREVQTLYNIVTVTFKDSNTATANGVRQWDYGQILRIQGLQLPTAVEVHFALIDSKDSVTRIGTTKDGVTDVVIPDSMIEAGKNIFAYVYLRDSESGQTEYEIKIVVTTRAKPEAFDTPEDKELFAQAIEAVNEAADRAEKAGQAATEAAGQAAEDAQQTAQDRAEVAKMVETVTDISEQVKKVEELSNKAQESATQAGTSATAAEKAKAQAETAAGKTAEDRTAVNQAKIAVDEAQKAVRADRAAVEEAKQSVEQLSNAIPESTQVGVQAVNQAKQTAVDEIARTGTSHKTAVEGAGTQAVESVENVKASATEAVETAKTEAVQSVQTEGNTQTGNVTTEGTKQVKAVQDKGTEVLQSIPEDFQTQMETKLNKQQGIENKGKALVIGEDGNVVPGEVASGGGDGIAIINTMSGESPLVIPDSAERVNKRLELGGKTEQVQTSGKNLANPSEFVIGTIAGDTGNIINLKQYITTGYIPVIPGKRYSTSCGNKFLAHTITAYDKEKTKINTVINMSSEMPEGAAYIRLSYKKIDMTNVTESDMEELKKVCMANEGSTVLPYEPYTGGKPSPSPEYPQKIKNAGKWNEETQKYEVDVKVTNAEQNWSKEQTITITSDRPITKWDRLVEQGGQIGWLYNSVNETIDGKTGKWSIQPASKIFYRTDITFPIVVPFCIELLGYDYSSVGYKKDTGISINNLGILCITLPEEVELTLDAYKQYLADNPLHVLYKGDSEEFVPLPQSEQNAIRALKTYYPTTVITADGGELGPDIKVTYTADTKNYIDGKVSAKVASIIRQYRLNTANLLSLMPMETQAAMIENDTNNILENAEEMKRE